MKKAFVNCDIFTGDEFLTDRAVIVRDNKIDSIISNRAALRKRMDVVDLKGATIAPGFIDTQVNGGGGVLLNDTPTRDAVKKVADAHRRFGVTSIMPTIFTETEDKISALWSAVQSHVSAKDYSVIGAHFEGPVINPKKAGVHDPKKASRSSSAGIEALRNPGTSKIIVTLAPEVADNEFLKLCAASPSTIVLAGHTAATFEEMLSAFESGVDGVTHLYNAMTGPASREPGAVTATFLAEDKFASIIVDGFHVHFGSVRHAWKSKSPGKLYLVTDAMPPVGSEITDFKIGGLDLTCRDGRCLTEEGVLGGSAADMATCVRNCIQKVGIPKGEALRMASRYVAEMIGLDDELGSIARGYFANMVILNNEMAVLGVVRAGELETY